MDSRAAVCQPFIRSGVITPHQTERPSSASTRVLSGLHQMQLVLLRQIRQICDEHRIPYFLIAGTLLGAVRHQGFIPWDDDLDVGMLRADYDRFVSACNAELDCHKFFLQTHHTDRGYGLSFAKLQAKGTKLIERNAVGTSAAKGIYVDIFPFDNVPDDVSLSEKHRRKTYVLKRLLLAKLGYRFWDCYRPLKSLACGLLSTYARCCSQDRLVADLDEEMRRYNHRPTERIVAIGGSYGYRRETIRREWVTRTVNLPFEDEEFPAPAAYAAYLTHLYGDYMTPVPVSQRVSRHGVLQIDLGGWRN
jgi:lipopolysaccharide cholinephosphotransferase